MLKVWIELEKPKSPEHARELVTAANAMMAKLGCHDEVFGIIDGRFVHNLSDNAGFIVLNDNGEWFNLEYLARSTADEA